MGVTKITTHSADAVARLLHQYKGAANIEGLLGVYGTQVQELEDATHAMLLNRTLENATGDQLDALGEIVGQERQGADDEDYRIKLKFRIGVNVSEATLNEVATLFKLISGKDEIHVHNNGGGMIEIEYAA